MKKISSISTQWTPLWGSIKPKDVSPNEYSFILRVAKLIDITPSHIEPVLAVNGVKQLRVKMFRGIEHFIERYDYFFFGRIIEKENKTHCEMLVKAPNIPGAKRPDGYLPKETLMVLDDKELAKHIRAAIYDETVYNFGAV